MGKDFDSPTRYLRFLVSPNFRIGAFFILYINALCGPICLSAKFRAAHLLRSTFLMTGKLSIESTVN